MASDQVEKLQSEMSSIEVMKSALESYHLSQVLAAEQLRLYFLKLIFQIEISEKDHYFESFFKHYASVCELAANKNREIERVNHWQMARIIILMHQRGLRKDAIFEESTHILRETFSKTSIYTSRPNDLRTVLLELAAGMWLMVSIGEYPGNISYDEPIDWSPKESLAEDSEMECISNPQATTPAVLSRIFSSKADKDDTVKLPQTFTADHLEQIGGLEIIWTSNLADHLLLKEDDRKLMLFHQVSILDLHLKSSVSIFPKTLIDETIRTLSLLNPTVLEESNAWFKQQQLKIQQQRLEYTIDSCAGRCGRLNSSERQIEKFQWWRNRLVLLKRTYDEAEPRTVSQLWRDDRKKTQWFTFWVAVLVFFVTVFFGIIQSIASIVQAWASMQSLKAQNAPSSSPP